MLITMDNEPLGVVAGCHGLAENASGRFLGGGNVGVTPRGPEVIHVRGRVADGRRAAKLAGISRIATQG
jgi:hypothetical protein